MYRHWAATAIDRMARLEELISTNVIVVVPAPIVNTDLDKAAAQAVDPSLVSEFPSKPPDYWGLGDHQIAAMDIAQQLAAARGAVDPYLPTRGHAAVFRALMTSADETMRSTTADATPPKYGAILPHVIKADVVEPVGVSLADIVAIRRNGQFDPWRDAVAEGVTSYIDRVGNDGRLYVPNLLREEIAEKVSEKAKEVQQSLSWTKRRSIRLTVRLAAVGGGIAATFLPPLGLIPAGLEGGQLLATQFARWRFARGAFARQVAVFNDRPRSQNGARAR